VTLEEALALPGATLVAGFVETDFDHGHKALGRVINGVYYPSTTAIEEHTAGTGADLDAALAAAAVAQEAEDAEARAALAKADVAVQLPALEDVAHLLDD